MNAGTTTQLARTRMVAQLRNHGIRDEAVLKAIESLPRELFVAQAFAAEAYENSALPIGESQTISQPLVVAKMTEALQVNPTSKVLEIGTGSGYQAAVLCKLVRRLFSIERIDALAEVAVKRLYDLRINNFAVKCGDGTLGWSEQAPFDRIMLTAAGPKVPQPLLDQLKPGGILVAPVGPVGVARQTLVRCIKQEDGTIHQESLGAVSFVPLIGSHGVTLKRA